LIGHGPQEALYGIEEGTVLSQVSHTLWHKDPLSDEEMLAGATRWNRWHIDSSFHTRAPPIVTTLHALKVPQGPELTVRWDDGSGNEMKSELAYRQVRKMSTNLLVHPAVQAGTTAFLDGAKIYSLLSAEQKLMAENSKVSLSLRFFAGRKTNLSLALQVVYAPHPFRKHAAVRGRSNGLGQWSERLEAPLEDLPPWEEQNVLTYPMLWTNPQTGEKALQGLLTLYRPSSATVLRRRALPRQRADPLSFSLHSAFYCCLEVAHQDLTRCRGACC